MNSTAKLVEKLGLVGQRVKDYLKLRVCNIVTFGTKVPLLPVYSAFTAY